MTTWAIEYAHNPKASYKRSVTSSSWTLAWTVWKAITARDGMRYRFKRNNLIIARKK
jgi:hypothetical protein